MPAPAGAFSVSLAPPAVQILYAGVSSLYTLADAKSTYLQQAFGLSREEFLQYGFRQLADSILEVRSPGVS